MLNKLSLFFGIFLIYFSANAELFKAQEFFLGNGLHVVVVENHKAPVIKQMLWYNVGSAHDGLGKGGRAHFLEHLMFRGTNKVKDGEFNALMENNGISSNAFTSYEVTAYHEFADISKLELLLALEADRMKNLNFDKDAFNTEKQVIIQEREQVIENNPAAPFNEKFREIVWGNNPFGHPITGLKEEIVNLSYDDVKTFYNRYYSPKNAILVLSGDITIDEAKPLVEKYFGNIKNRPIKARFVGTPVLKEKFSQQLEMSLPNIKTPRIVWYYVLPPYAKIKGSVYDYEALEQYLGSGKTSALYRDLVLNRKIALSVGANFSFITHTNASFSLSMVPAEGISISEAKEALKDALQKAVTELNEQKLASVKKKMVADLVYVQDNPSTAANIIGNLLTNGFSLDFLQSYEADVDKISLKGVKDAYHEIFFNSSNATGVLLPQIEENEK